MHGCKEDWEPEVIKKQGPVNKAKLLQKYGGLNWVDPDYGDTFTACKEHMYWSSKRKSRGYCLKGLLPAFDAEAPDDNDWEPWVLDPECLHCLIVEYIEKHPCKDLVLVKRKQEDSDEEGEDDRSELESDDQ